MSGTISDNIGRSSGSITEPAGGVEILSSDPTLSNGLMWYNSTSNTLKVARQISAWSSGANYPTNTGAQTGNGTVTAGLAFGGVNGAILKTSYEYNGTAWASNVNMANIRKWAGGAGSQTSTLTMAGQNSHSGSGGWTNTSESYNGSSWSGEATFTGGSWGGLCGCGASETAALTACAKTGAGANYTNATHEYNGSAWSTEGNSNFSGESRTGTGIQTAALYAGGYNASGYSLTSEEYNGSTHSAGNSLATARAHHGAAGTVTDALMFDGDSPTTEVYNGDTYSAGTANDGRLGSAADGASSTSAWTAGGSPDGWGSVLNTMKIFSEGLLARTVTDS